MQLLTTGLNVPMLWQSVSRVTAVEKRHRNPPLEGGAGPNKPSGTCPAHRKNGLLLLNSPCCVATQARSLREAGIA